MIWTKSRDRFGNQTKYAITNGTHTIAKYKVDDKFTYVVFRKGKNAARLGQFNNAHDAKLEAVEDLKRNAANKNTK